MSFDRGDLIWLDFNPHKGHEQAGRRPALVLSPLEYNALSNCVLVCPITSNTAPWPWKVILPDGLPVSGAVLVDQVKSLDARARRFEAMGGVAPPDIIQEVIARLRTLTG